MINDFLTVFKWWLYILLIGIPFIPLTNFIFKDFFDKGYLFSKTISIIILSYTIWLLSSLKILTFSRFSILFILILFMVFAAAFSIHKRYLNLEKLNIQSLKIFILEELLFLAGLLFWSYVRGFNPKINGLEKYMDFGFVNALLKCNYMPPADIWFAGNNINYYYFGHYICAFLTKLSQIPSSYTYNLMLASIFSFTLCLTFSIVSNMTHLKGKTNFKKVIIAGIISALLITFGGTLHTFIYTAGIHVQQYIGLFKGTIKPYFYADATRYIGYNPSTNDKTIHEFPLYSFVVSDLHGHVSDIPFVLTFIAILLNFFSDNTNKLRNNISIAIMSLLLATFYMTNTWDYPMYLMAAGFTLLYLGIKKYNNIASAFGYAVINGIILVAVSQILVLPFTLKFKQIANGVGLVAAHTPLYQLAVLWGYQLFFVACFAVFLAVSKKQNNFDFKDFYTIILSACAIILVILPEVIYIIDIYGITYQRANTMFKFTYQAFIMFSIVTGYIAVQIVTNIQKRYLRNIIAVFFTLILILPMIYPFYAIKGYYGNIKPSNYKELYGLDYLNESYPDDLKVINWINTNIKNQAVILEANGDSYTDYCRISASTGNPTIIGWYAHEWLWRGYSDELNNRVNEVKTVYESDNLQETKKIIHKYNVKYIVIGKLERNKFTKLNENKLKGLGKVVFKSNDTYLIKLQ